MSMRDQYDGSRIPTRFSPFGTFVMALALVAAVVVVAIGQARLDDRQQRFPSCDAAREAGAPLPMTPGDPGWNPLLDTDRNGQAC